MASYWDYKNRPRDSRGRFIGGSGRFSGHLVDFDLNRQTVEAIAVGPACRAMVTAHGEMAKVFAQTLSSNLRTKENHPHYQDSFELDVDIVYGITTDYPMPRVGSKLSNSAPHANFVEFGTIHYTDDGRMYETRGYHILGDTLDWLWSLDPHQGVP